MFFGDKEGYNMKEFCIPSTDGKSQLHVVIWEPDIPVSGIVQISHGMIEYVKRYDQFAWFLNQEGFLVIGNDHLGHGETAKNDDKLGYFCTSNMSQTVVADLYEVTRFAKKYYPDVPYFLFGHSMGSFMARRYIMTYGNEIDGVIISGTGNQPKIVLKAGKMMTTLTKLFKGDHYRSAMLKKMFFSKFNKHIPNVRTSNDWLTKDEVIVDNYNKDKYCTYSFTVNGYRTLLEVLSFIQDSNNIAQIPKNLPIFLIAGEEDPVGNYGKAVRHVYEIYKKAGIGDISLKLYKNDRHELINETDKETVYADITNWLTCHL